MEGQQRLTQIIRTLLHKKQLVGPMVLLFISVAGVVSAAAAWVSHQTRVIGEAVSQAASSSPVFAAASPQHEEAQLAAGREPCTYPVEYWLSVPERWPAQISLGGVSYSRSDLLAMLNTPAEHITVEVIRSTFGVIMNLHAGATAAWLEDSLTEVDAWLAQNPIGSPISEFNRRRGLALAENFDNFNRGLLFPGLCPPPAVAQVVPTQPVQTPSPTASPQAAAASSLPLIPEPEDSTIDMQPAHTATDVPLPPPTATELPPPPADTAVPTQPPAPTQAPPAPSSGDSNSGSSTDEGEQKNKDKDNDKGKDNDKDKDKGKGKGK